MPKNVSERNRKVDPITVLKAALAAGVVKGLNKGKITPNFGQRSGEPQKPGASAPAPPPSLRGKRKRSKRSAQARQVRAKRRNERRKRARAARRNVGQPPVKAKGEAPKSELNLLAEPKGVNNWEVHGRVNAHDLCQRLKHPMTVDPLPLQIKAGLLKTAKTRLRQAQLTPEALDSETITNEEASAHEALDDALDEELEAYEGVPIAHKVTLEGELPALKEVEKGGGERVFISGSEYLASVKIVAGSKVGDCLFTLPLNPTLMGSTRLKKFSDLYDLFAVKGLVLEYIPSCSMQTQGMILGLCSTNPAEEMTMFESADAVLRDGYTRPGASLNSVISKAAYVISCPQQAQYFCAPESDPELAIPSLFSLFQATDGDPSLDTNLGVIVCHYEMEFWQATNNAQAATLAVGPTKNSLALTVASNHTATASWFISLGDIAAPLNAAISRNQFGCMTLNTFSPSTLGTNWLTFYDGQKQVVWRTGMRLWFRLAQTQAGVLGLVFYGSLRAVLQDEDVQIIDVPVATNGRLACAFTLAVTGTPTGTFTYQLWNLTNNG